MKANPEKPIQIVSVDDAEAMYAAMQAASLYDDIVQCIPQPTVEEFVHGKGDVHVGSAEYCLEKFGADRFTFAWLVMRGFEGK